MTDKYDKKGKPLTLEQWAKLLEDRDYCRIALTESDEYLFSTIWIGLDHSFGGPRPEIFESMAFEKDKQGNRNPSGVYMARYCTLTEARIGHLKMIVSVYAKDAWNYLKERF